MKIASSTNFLVNPYIKIAGGKALVLGIIIMILNSWIMAHSKLYIGMTGIVGLETGYPTPYWTGAFTQAVSWIIPACLFLLFGFLFSKSKIRAIDVLGTSALAQITVFFQILIFAPEFMVKTINSINAGEVSSVAASDVILMGILSIVALLLIIWHFIFLFQSFKTSCNIKGGKLAALFALSMIISIPASMMINHEASMTILSEPYSEKEVDMDVIGQKNAMRLVGGWEAKVETSPTREVRILLNFEVDENWKVKNLEVFIPERGFRKSFETLFLKQGRYDQEYPYLIFKSREGKERVIIDRITRDSIRVSFREPSDSGTSADLIVDVKCSKVSPASNEIQKLREALPERPSLTSPLNSGVEYQKSATGKNPKIAFLENPSPQGYRTYSGFMGNKECNRLFKFGDGLCRLSHYYSKIGAKEYDDCKNFARVEFFDKNLNFQKSFGLEMPDGIDTHISSIEKLDDKRLVFVLHSNIKETKSTLTKVCTLNAETGEVKTLAEGKETKDSLEKYIRAVPSGNGNIILALQANGKGKEKTFLRIVDPNGKILKESGFSKKTETGENPTFIRIKKLIRTEDGKIICATSDQTGYSSVYVFDKDLNETARQENLKGIFADMIPADGGNVVIATTTRTKTADLESELSLNYRIFDTDPAVPSSQGSVKIKTFIGTQGLLAMLSNGNFVFVEDNIFKYTVFSSSGKIITEYEIPANYGARKGALEMNFASGLVSENNAVYISGGNDALLLDAQYLFKINLN